MRLKTISVVRDLGRLNEIATVLIRYGFGDIVQRVGLTDTLRRAGHVLHWQGRPEQGPPERPAMKLPERVRRMLEELGPTFIKLGQILATRVDLFPPEWIAEFSRLQDAVPAVPFAELAEQLTQDLGAPPEDVFAHLDTQPLAAASLAQVHLARLASGVEVALKIRRPGIVPRVEADLRLLSHLASLVDMEAPDLRRYRLREIVAQFTQSLRRELDFSAEARISERIAMNFAGHAEILIPRIHWQWTSERLNVQDYITGVPARDLNAVAAAGLDRQVLARRGAQAVLKMILEDGLYHADPHPGNVLYLPGNALAFIDFGMFGRLSAERRYELARILFGLASQEAGEVVEVLLGWSGDVGIDDSALRSEVDAFIDRFRGVPLRRLRFSNVLLDLVSILRAHELSLPPDLALLIKTFVTLDGLGRQLDPDFDMTSEAAPYIAGVLATHAAPAAVAERGWRALKSGLFLLASLPRDVQRLLRAARRGKIQVQVEVVPLKQFGERIDRAASRLALSIVTGSLIVGSAIVLTVERRVSTPGRPSLALVGFIAAVICGVWVLISTWRGGRH
jgi:ubiquinone biosynthesis protein